MIDLTVIIPTYNRSEILEETIALLRENLRYDGKVRVLIGDDSGRVIHNKPDPDIKQFPVKIIPGPENGLGANLNMLITEAKTDVILQMDDDHHLVKPLDITQYVTDLSEFKNAVGWIRIFLGTEKDLSNDDPFYRFVARMYERYWYLIPKTGEIYIASNRPHLKRRDFHVYYGLYKEDLKLGETETEFCHRYSDLWKVSIYDPDCPHVVIPVAAPSFDTWQHVGSSWQKRGY